MYCIKAESALLDLPAENTQLFVKKTLYNTDTDKIDKFGF